MADKKKNSFRDMMLIIFVVVACFGLTIYGIIYLAGKVFAPEEKIEMMKVKPTPSVTNPENGDILTFTSKPEKKPEEQSAQANVMPPAAEPATPVQPAAKPKQDAPKQTAEKKDSIPTPPVKAPAEQQKREQPAQAQPVPAAPVKPAPVQPPAPVKQTPETPKAAPQTQKAPSKGRYVVQIMSLKSQSAAESEAVKFRNACPDVHVVKAELGSKGTWYRVRCGVTDSKTIANDTKNKIATEFKIAPQVVPNE